MKKIDFKGVFLCLGLLACLSYAIPAYAQGETMNADDFLSNSGAQTQPDATAQPTTEMTEIERGIAEAKEENNDKDTLGKKLALAEEMHRIRPTRMQVDSAVVRASYSLPPQSRRGFISSMQGMLNYNAIERISVDAMVEVYTLRELESMVEYYSKPEAKSASDKIGNWAAIIQPEIANMIDKAMMRIRTGQ